MEQPHTDIRSGQIMILSHCILNQNSAVGGSARFPGAMRPIIEPLLERGIGIYQMPCPENSCYGLMRWGQVRAQYNTPMFRRHCQELARRVLDEIEDYLRNGYEVLGFIMIDGSPSCGLARTCEPAAGSPPWGGELSAAPSVDFVPGQGVFCEVLRAEIECRGLRDIPFAAVPEITDPEALHRALQELMARLLVPG